MAEPPILFDRAALMRARQRAARAPADFLQAEVARQVKERLGEVNRRFTSAAVIGPRAALWVDALGLPGAHPVADADVLALDAGAHDLVIHALCLHAANDVVGQLIQCHRALRPDGLLVATMFGGRTLTELRQALAAAEADVTGGLSPRVAPMADIRDAGALLQRAGLALPVADSDRLTVTYPDMTALMRDLRAMGEVNVLAARNRRWPPRSLFARAGAIYAAGHAGSDGRIPATFEVLTLTGWRPDASQPQPLRPGSAAHRMAAALGTEEIGANDPVPPGARRPV
jgi:SAM-dependent methyltransferase